MPEVSSFLPMSEKTQRIVLWVLAILLVGGTGLALRFARGYRPLAGLPGDAPSLPLEISVRFRGLRVFGRDRGRPAWTLTAGQMDTTPAHARIQFSRGITAVLLDRGKPAATLAAPAALYDSLVHTLHLTGAITGSFHNLRVTTSLLDWDTGSQIVRCPGAVHAVHPRGELSGNRLLLNLRTQEYTLEQFHLRAHIDETAGTGL